jgi:hypothetical protein
MRDRPFVHLDSHSERSLPENVRGPPVETEDHERRWSSGAAARKADENLPSAEQKSGDDTPTYFVNGVLNVGLYEFLSPLDAVKRSAWKRFDEDSPGFGFPQKLSPQSGPASPGAERPPAPLDPSTPHARQRLGRRRWPSESSA